MYLTMNQEDNRGKINSVVDERTLQEIYLPPLRPRFRAEHVGDVSCAPTSRPTASTPAKTRTC